MEKNFKRYKVVKTTTEVSRQTREIVAETEDAAIKEFVGYGSSNCCVVDRGCDEGDSRRKTITAHEDYKAEVIE